MTTETGRPVRGTLPSFQSLTVLEIAEGIAGPVCGLQLADLGARVIKIEPPEGDRTREWGPPMIGDTAAIFCHLNRGKESVVLDLATDAGRAALEPYLARADAVIYHADPDIRAEHALDWRAIAARHPRLVVADMTDVGDKGSLSHVAGSELVLQALSGFTRYIGDPGGEPCRLGNEFASIGAGMYTYQSIVAALLERERSGRGQRVGVCALTTVISMKTILLATQVEPDKWEGFHLHGPHWPADYGWKTRDGQVTFDFRHGDREGWVKFCEAIGLADLPNDPTYKDWRSTIYIGDRRHTAGKVYEPWFASVDCETASGLINRLGGISVKFQDAAEMLSNEQVRIIGPTIAVDSDAPGERTQLAGPLKFHGATAAQPRRAPRLGEHGGVR